MANMIDSVPPDDTVPHTVGRPSSPPPSMAAVMATISDSNFTELGHRSGWSGLAWELRA